MWRIEFTHGALKLLLRMPRDQSTQIRRKLDDVARDPFRAANVKKLIDQDGYRLRVGDWRVLYLLHRDRIVVHVVRIAPRGGAYRR